MGEDGLWMNEEEEEEHTHSYPLKNRGREELWQVWPQEWENCEWMKKMNMKEDITIPIP